MGTSMAVTPTAGVVVPTSIIGMSNDCVMAVFIGVDIVGKALISGVIDGMVEVSCGLTLARGVEGSCLTLLGEKGIMASETQRISTSSASSVAMASVLTWVMVAAAGLTVAVVAASSVMLPTPRLAFGVSPSRRSATSLRLRSDIL